jgi:hypothetical protein
MPYEPIDIPFTKAAEPLDLSDCLLDLQDIDAFLDGLSWTAVPGPLQRAPIRAKGRRRP